jgi:hypothetical protein
MATGTGVTSPANANGLPDAWIERIFQRMEDRYGDLWAQRYGAFPRERVKRSWADDLSEMSGEEIARGVVACRDLKFPPTLPEFRALCRPPVDPEAAFFEAAEQLSKRATGKDRWSHRAIFWACVALGQRDILTGTWGSLKARWTRLLAAELARGEWPEIPPRLVSLPAQKRGISPEAAKERWEQIKKTLGNPAIDPLSWAKNPRSQIAANKLIEAAKDDPRLARILEQNIARGNFETSFLEGATKNGSAGLPGFSGRSDQASAIGGFDADLERGSALAAKSDRESGQGDSFSVPGVFQGGIGSCVK